MRRSYKGVPINTSKNTHETVFELLDQENKSRAIADIPSGAGAFVLRLKENGFTNVSAIDIENILEIEHNDFLVGDMTKSFPFDDNTIDSMVCIDGIEHISKQFDFVAEVGRVLKPGGEFIVSTPNISSLRSRWKWFSTGHHHKCSSPLDENNPNSLHHIGMISFPEIRYLLHTNGFKIVTVATNRIKSVSWIYSFLLPCFYLRTSIIYGKSGKKEGTSKMMSEIQQKMFSKEILFGETMIIKAIRN